MTNSNLSDKEQRLLNLAVNDWIEKLTEGEISSIYSYTINEYKLINEYLHGDSSHIINHDHILNQIKNISSGLQKFSYQGWLTVYKGISEIEYLKILNSGEFKEFNSFKSTSLDLAIASEFPEYLNQDKYLLEIKLPPGTNGAFIDPITDLEESEFLLNRNTRYKITNRKIDHDNDLNIIYLEVIV